MVATFQIMIIIVIDFCQKQIDGYFLLIFFCVLLFEKRLPKRLGVALASQLNPAGQQSHNNFLIRLGLLKIVFHWWGGGCSGAGGVNLKPSLPLIFQEELIQLLTTSFLKILLKCVKQFRRYKDFSFNINYFP